MNSKQSANDYYQLLSIHIHTYFVNQNYVAGQVTIPNYEYLATYFPGEG